MPPTTGVNFPKILLNLFCKKGFCAAFLYSQFSFATFWQNNIDAKAPHTMLVKLTTGVNFSNIL